MKKAFNIIIFFLLSSFVFAEQFKGLFGIEFGQTSAVVRKNIESNGFSENELSVYSANSGHDEISFSKKKANFIGLDCNFLTVVTVFNEKDVMNEILVCCENYSLDNEELYFQIAESLNTFTNKYEFNLVNDEDYNTQEIFIKQFIDKHSHILDVSKNHGLILFDFKINDNSSPTMIENIKWKPVTTYEYLGEDSKYSYLLDFYDDFSDAKINENKITNKKKSNYDILQYFKSSECTVAKLKIFSKETEEFTTIILFVENNILYEAEFK